MKNPFKSSIRLDPTWTGRRRAIAFSLISVVGLTGFAIFYENETAVTPLITLWGWIVTNYLGWPTVERINGIPSQSEHKDV